MDDERKSAQVPNEGTMREFVDALTTYAIDPGRWPDLIEQFDRLGDRIQSWDVSELVAELSRAESLSFSLKQDGSSPDHSGFAYLLLDDRDRITGSSSNFSTLSDYLTPGDDGSLEFTHADSQVSLDIAKENLQGSRKGHSLVSLNHPDRPRHRYGFLISRSEFTPQLDRIAGNATRALFVAQDDDDARLQGVVRASFGLTAMETDVTMKLVHGMALKEAAEDLRISINTARNHLQSVFAKSGINRQSDLLLVVTQLGVILARTEGDAVARVGQNEPQIPPRHFMILPEGRRLAYRTYGDPGGKPVVYLHETLGCSRLPPVTQALSERLGLYLISLDRPGFGFSDEDPRFSFPSVANDLAHLMDHLGVARATLIGFLSGGAYALWFANTLRERVERLVLVASRPPRPMKGRFRSMMPIYTRMVSQPWLLSSFFNILRNRASAETNARLINTVYGSVPHDRAYLEANADLFDHMVAYTMESMTVTAAGVASELKCFAEVKQEPYRPSGPPISAWHGGADNLAGIEELLDYLKGSPVSWHKFDDAGSLILLEHWAEILEDVAGVESPPVDG
jgi:pimeloyl-ACP methyl ester carboxylesterase/DNA-binding CsgD family transcriptional regulator